MTDMTVEATPPKDDDAETRSGEAALAADPIARSLRELFRATEQEAMPDRFRALLDRLAAEERQS